MWSGSSCSRREYPAAAQALAATVAGGVVTAVERQGARAAAEAQVARGEAREGLCLLAQPGAVMARAGAHNDNHFNISCFFGSSIEKKLALVQKNRAETLDDQRKRLLGHRMTPEESRSFERILLSMHGAPFAVLDSIYKTIKEFHLGGRISLCRGFNKWFCISS